MTHIPLLNGTNVQTSAQTLKECTGKGKLTKLQNKFFPPLNYLLNINDEVSNPLEL